MFATLILTMAVAIPTQIPTNPQESTPKSAPKPFVPNPAYEKLIAKRKAEAATKARVRTAKQQQEYAAAEAQRAYEAKMAPIWAQQAKDAAQLNIAQQKANAMSSIANAAQKEVVIDGSRLKIQARQAGYPQIGFNQYVP